MGISLKTKMLAPIAASALAVCSLGANAAQILGFGQSGTGVTATLAQDIPGVGQTTLSMVNAGIIITNYAGPGAPLVAFMNLSAVSFSAATLTSANDILQKFAGTFCITSLAGCGGTNYLSGTFNDDLSGEPGGNSLTLDATAPPESDLVFTSGILAASQLELGRGMGLSFSNVTPGGNICGGDGQVTFCNATMSTSGTFSANVGQVEVPEPGTLALLGLGLAGLAASRRRKQ